MSLYFCHGTEKQKIASHPFLLADELEMEGCSGLFFGKNKSVGNLWIAEIFKMN